MVMLTRCCKGYAISIKLNLQIRETQRQLYLSLSPTSVLHEHIGITIRFSIQILCYVKNLFVKEVFFSLHGDWYIIIKYIPPSDIYKHI